MVVLALALAACDSDPSSVDLLSVGETSSKAKLTVKDSDGRVLFQETVDVRAELYGFGGGYFGVSVETARWGKLQLGVFSSDFGRELNLVDQTPSGSRAKMFGTGTAIINNATAGTLRVDGAKEDPAGNTYSIKYKLSDAAIQPAIGAAPGPLLFSLEGAVNGMPHPDGAFYGP
jgi:hypothetical protein